MDHQQNILDNLTRILDVTDKSKAAELVKMVKGAGATFIGGAGRSLLVSRFFAMRLVHSGHKVFMVGEVVTPAIKEGDLLILVSGSGPALMVMVPSSVWVVAWFSFFSSFA